MKTVVAFDHYPIPENGVAGRCHVLSDKNRDALLDFIVGELPECYIKRATLLAQAEKTGKSVGFHLANKLPDRGAVMSGDFGEILTLFFLAHERAESVTLMRKWVHKNDRQKAAPHSDVLILHAPNPGKPVAMDYLISAEAKQKATPSKKYAPIDKAIAGVDLDRTGRLGRCLTWLREKAYEEGDAKEIERIERFATSLVPYTKHFKAVAIIDLALLDGELLRQPTHAGSPEFEVVVLGIRNLQAYYELAFDRAPKEVKP